MKSLDKPLMFLFQLCLIFSVIKSDYVIKEISTKSDQWKCPDLDTALLDFKISNEISDYKNDLSVLYQYEICNKCDLIPLKYIRNSTQNKNENVILDSYYSYNFEVVFDNLNLSNESVICSSFTFKNFGECGEYLFEINGINNCEIKTIKSPNNPNKYLYLALGLVILFMFVSNFIEKYGLKILTRLKPKVNPESQNIYTEKQSKTRLRSLDAFRGFSLFLMIFINYGSGGYKFLKHETWHGITIADFVVILFVISN